MFIFSLLSVSLCTVNASDTVQSGEFCNMKKVKNSTKVVLVFSPLTYDNTTKPFLDALDMGEGLELRFFIGSGGLFCFVLNVFFRGRPQKDKKVPTRALSTFAA